jgi:hypothetical protein
VWVKSFYYSGKDGKEQPPYWRGSFVGGENRICGFLMGKTKDDQYTIQKSFPLPSRERARVRGQ